MLLMHKKSSRNLWIMEREVCEEHGLTFWCFPL